MHNVSLTKFEQNTYDFISSVPQKLLYNYGISNPLFTHLWKIFITFLLMQAKTGFLYHIKHYFTLFINYHKHGKSFIKIIQLPASYALRRP